MKNIFFLLSFLCMLNAGMQAQSVAGYWYGPAYAQTKNSASNYLVELIIKENKGYVQGVMNYYFKNSFRSVAISGNYNSRTRYITLRDIPITYFGSFTDMEVDCIMTLEASLRISKNGSNMVGFLGAKPGFKYTCLDINFNFELNADVSKNDSILTALKNFKESHQVWKPGAADTLEAVNVIQRKVVNYVIDNEYKKREKEIAREIEVESDKITLDFYDNGEVDGDSISVFVNNDLLAFNRKISTRPVHFDIVLDSTKEFTDISMFADNLGSIPPNTALMILTDGKNRYEIRLSSNLEKSATVRVRQKKKPLK